MFQVLSRLPTVKDVNLLVGNDTGDDAAVYRMGEDLALVQTVDFFPPIVDDPYWYGTIAVANSLSDVYAMGGKPLLGMNIVCFPASLDKEILVTILKGGYEKAREADVLIVGGHTIDDPEPKYGLAVTGVVQPGRQVTNATARPGDRLVLTKPIGTGVLTTAAKADLISPKQLEPAVQAMATLNRAASEAMLAVGVNACTDITGFGLLGHLAAMVTASGVGARVQLSAVPALPGAWDLIREGVAPGGTHRNLISVGKLTRWHRSVSDEGKIFLSDAQTSGGLLMAVPAERLDLLLRELRQRGIAPAVIGEVLDSPRPGIEVVP